MRDYLKKYLNYKSCRPVPEPWVTHSDCVKRLTFATKYKDWGLDEWHKVLRSDEASFAVTDDQRGRIYYPSSSDLCDLCYTKHMVENPDSLMVWGCFFSYHDVGKLVFLPKNITMNQNSYFDHILDELEPCMDWYQAEVFMQNWTPCHTAKLVIKWFEFCTVKLITPCPENLPQSEFNREPLGIHQTSATGLGHFFPFTPLKCHSRDLE